MSSPRPGDGRPDELGLTETARQLRVSLTDVADVAVEPGEHVLGAIRRRSRHRRQAKQVVVSSLAIFVFSVGTLAVVNGRYSTVDHDLAGQSEPPAVTPAGEGAGNPGNPPGAGPNTRDTRPGETNWVQAGDCGGPTPLASCPTTSTAPGPGVPVTSPGCVDGSGPCTTVMVPPGAPQASDGAPGGVTTTTRVPATAVPGGDGQPVTTVPQTEPGPKGGGVDHGSDPPVPATDRPSQTTPTTQARIECPAITIAGPNTDTACLLRAFQSGRNANLDVEIAVGGDPARIETRNFQTTAGPYVIVNRSTQCTNLEAVGAPEWYLANGTCINF